MFVNECVVSSPLCAVAVQDKLDQMVFLWSNIQALVEEREAKLLDVMDLADKFWCDHCALIVTIKDTQDLLREQEEPGVDPSVVKQQQEALEVRAGGPGGEGGGVEERDGAWRRGRGTGGGAWGMAVRGTV